MASEESEKNLKGIIGDLLGTMPGEAAERILRREAMQILWEFLDDDIKSRCAPKSIFVDKSGETDVLTCEIWIDDSLTRGIVLRDKKRIVRGVAEKLGRIAFEELSFKTVAPDLLRRQIAIIRGD